MFVEVAMDWVRTSAMPELVGWGGIVKAFVIVTKAYVMRGCRQDAQAAFADMEKRGVVSTSALETMSEKILELQKVLAPLDHVEDPMILEIGKASKLQELFITKGLAALEEK